MKTTEIYGEDWYIIDIPNKDGPLSFRASDWEEEFEWLNSNVGNRLNMNRVHEKDMLYKLHWEYQKTWHFLRFIFRYQSHAVEFKLRFG